MSKQETDDSQAIQKLMQELFQHCAEKIKKMADSPLTGLYIANIASFFSSTLTKPIESQHPFYSKIVRLLLSLIEKYALIGHQVKSSEHLQEVQLQVEALNKQLNRS